MTITQVIRSNSIDYLLQDRKHRGKEDEVERDSLDEIDPRTGAVPESEDALFHHRARNKEQAVTGRSIFTQDDVGPDGGGGHSLLEFEQLEAEVVGPDGDDLIGAYLKDLSDRDRDDEYHSVHTFREEDRNQAVLRPTSRDETLDFFEGDKKGKDNHLGLQSAFEEESLSLIENQQPPFITSLLSIDNSEGSGHNTSKDSSVAKASRIPHLRSRSPSMSRPGSTEPRSRTSSRSGSRSHSPVGGIRSRPRNNNSRTLPKTPQMSGRAFSNSRSRSRSSSAGSQLSGSRRSSIPRKLSRETTSSQEEQDKATLLADDAEVASLTSTGESKKRINKYNRPRPASAGSKPPVSRSKSEATINLSRPSSAKHVKHASSSRANTPKSFRVRSQSTTALVPAKQPLRASHRYDREVSFKREKIKREN